jgi:hypothetical protein
MTSRLELEKTGRQLHKSVTPAMRGWLEVSNDKLIGYESLNPLLQPPMM